TDLIEYEENAADLIEFEEKNATKCRLVIPDIVKFYKLCKKMKAEGVIVTNVFYRSSAKTRAKELNILLTKPEHAKGKIDDFFEDLKFLTISESSAEEI
ncbi:24261_t:CDS:1, partial [Dentiscutata erythropus]